MKSNNCEAAVVRCHRKNDSEKSKEYIITKAHEYKTDIIWYTKSCLQQWNALYNICEKVDAINDIQARILMQEILLQI